jgi:tRNA A-37 threonylcarbamoyl transferase component Bud32
MADLTPNAVASTSPYEGSAWTAPPPAALASRFPQLEILEMLGQGGMGAVYKARQAKLDRLVAVKILPAPVGRDPAFAERFAREARALAKLSHPQIVAVHDFGESDGQYYLVMEYVEGMNLRQLLRSAQLPTESALPILLQICEALQFAHDEGVVHRDIKPENILVDKRGRVKIADFGLAKLLNRPPAGQVLTGSQQVMGTPHYMAPEQMEKPLEVDQRADIYSMGVVFYEMLTGELPLGQFVPPSQKAPIDPNLDRIVLQALAREPQRRFQHISELKMAVEQVVRGTPTGTRSGQGGTMSPRFAWVREVGVRGFAGLRLLGWPGGWQQLFGTTGGWALLVCLAGVAVGFIPWIRIDVTTPTNTFGFTSFTVSGAGGSTWQNAFENWQGITATVTFGVLALLLYLAGRREQHPRWQPVPLLLAGLTNIVVVSWLLWELAHPPEPKVTQTTASADNPLFPLQQMLGGMLANMVQQMVKVTPQAGPYVALGLGISLLLLAACSAYVTRRRSWTPTVAQRVLPLSGSTPSKFPAP